MPIPVSHDTNVLIEGRRAYFGAVEGYAFNCWHQGTCNLICYEGWTYEDYLAQVLALNTKNGGTARWISLHSTVLADDAEYRDQDLEVWSKVPKLKIGDRIQFIGDDQVYRIETAPNRNYKLVEVLA